MSTPHTNTFLRLPLSGTFNAVQESVRGCAKDTLLLAPVRAENVPDNAYPLTDALTVLDALAGRGSFGPKSDGAVYLPDDIRIKDALALPTHCDRVQAEEKVAALWGRGAMGMNMTVLLAQDRLYDTALLMVLHDAGRHKTLVVGNADVDEEKSVILQKQGLTFANWENGPASDVVDTFMHEAAKKWKRDCDSYARRNALTLSAREVFNARVSDMIETEALNIKHAMAAVTTFGGWVDMDETALRGYTTGELVDQVMGLGDPRAYNMVISAGDVANRKPAANRQSRSMTRG